MKDTKLLGTIGEDFAESFLFAEGYTILARNYRTVFGEIDIICEKDGTICFVEVKTRLKEEFGEPADAVDEEKMLRIKRTAEYYMAEQFGHVSEISGKENIDEHIPNAAFKVIELLVRETDDDFMLM